MDVFASFSENLVGGMLNKSSSKSMLYGLSEMAPPADSGVVTMFSVRG